MRYLALLLLLAGCAQNNYQVIPGGHADMDDMKSTLDACRKTTIHSYYAQQSVLSKIPVGGLISVGISEMDDSQIKLKDIEPMVQKCMNDKGYTLINEDSAPPSPQTN